MNDIPETRRTLCRYRYDGLDRIAMVGMDTQDSVSRFYQQSRLTVEVQGSASRKVFQGGGQLLAEHGADCSSVQVELLGTDTQHSVLHAVSGQALRPLVYCPYGHRLPASILSGFNGERPDAMTGHYALGNGYRSFNPVLMRFNQPDSLSPFGRGGLNAYAYCLGDPINRRDPSGHIPGFSVPGPRMFPARLSLQKLPNEILAKVVRHLSARDAAALSATAPAMGQRVSGLLNKKWVDIHGPDALKTIKADLKGETRLSFAELSNDPFYRAQFEHAATIADQNMANQISIAISEKQLFIREVTGVSPASQFEFDRQLNLHKLNADNPGAWARIHRTAERLRQLDARAKSFISQRADTHDLAEEIRLNIGA